MTVMQERATLPEVLASNRVRLLRELELACHRFERQYELSSSDLEAALHRGTVRETSEVAQWVIAYRTLQRIRSSAAG